MGGEQRSRSFSADSVHSLHYLTSQVFPRSESMDTMGSSSGGAVMEAEHQLLAMGPTRSTSPFREQRGAGAERGRERRRLSSQSLDDLEKEIAESTSFVERNDLKHVRASASRFMGSSHATGGCVGSCDFFFLSLFLCLVCVTVVC